jgi:hypothetical protein
MRARAGVRVPQFLTNISLALPQAGVFLRGLTDTLVLPSIVAHVIAPLHGRVHVFVHTEGLSHTEDAEQLIRSSCQNVLGQVGVRDHA